MNKSVIKMILRGSEGGGGSAIEGFLDHIEINRGFLQKFFVIFMIFKNIYNI